MSSTESCCEVSTEAATQLADLVHRVTASSTFEKSPRLRAFLLHVCRCALDNKPELATEQQIGIAAYDRPPGYNPNEDNIVRSQARLLRMKLEHHFANEGKDEAIIITIPKGRYMPVFAPRTMAEAAPEVPTPQGTVAEGVTPEAENPSSASSSVEGRLRRMRLTLILVSVLAGIVVLVFAFLLWQSSTSTHPLFRIRADSVAGFANEADPMSSGVGMMMPGEGEVRIAAGRTGAAYVDVWGQKWEPDRYFEGGDPQPGPHHLVPRVPDEGLFGTIREAHVAQQAGSSSHAEFRYHIPLKPGVYELRLYFADPLNQPDTAFKEDPQNIRHFHVNLNGRPLLVGFDPIADAGNASVDTRVFKDVSPTADGKVHLEFFSEGNRPFVSAIELTPGTPGKLKPIRITAHKTGFVDADGTRWSADNYFISGRNMAYANPESGPNVPPLYKGERFGNFSYAIPVAPGSYTVKLHFMETFFTSLVPAPVCRGVGCRIFSVTCNGLMLLQDFDISQVAGGEFLPVVREFHGLHPNGQGKLLLSFSPKVNYAEVRAIEVIPE